MLMKKWQTILLICIVAVIIIAGAKPLLVSIFGEWPGFPSNYPAEDYDPRLTVQASSAVPVIQAAELYYAKHHQYPMEGKDLLPFLTSDLPTEGQLYGWAYVNETEGFQLYQSLGWDPRLIYVHTTSSSHWVFDPGDGSPAKKIQLKP
ncbi:hypothetical protein WJU23_01720 [Prosthecobacter sp. SYSU 5D2]|uniref:hypothetical protein n=1 Tax=Prosthecobacter sp. SYSU 5D2 TaxID=3134134 RepID=UPI0031FED5C2